MSVYDTREFNTLERVILLEDIHFSEPTNLVGKFSVGFLTPLEKQTGVNTSKIGKITSINYTELVIPAYITYQFMTPALFDICKYHKLYSMVFNTNKFVIPKGTSFLVLLLGGEIDKSENIQIVGVELAPQYNQ